jgi:molecular chaperone GrpE
MTNKQDTEEASSEELEPQNDNLGQDESINTDGVPDSEALQKALEEADKHRDVALRAEAEMQNLRRRVDRDIQNAHKFGIERLLQNLLPVVDSIEKAIEASEQAETPTDDPQFEGIKLCHKLFIDVMVKEGIEAVDPQGEPFDPNLHEALSMVESVDLEPNSVIAVIQKGYRLHGRLIRPAMVIVSKSA